MFQYLLILVAGLAVLGAPSLESLASIGASMDYVVAIGVALLFTPWLRGHFE
jgi:hypothetical protein